MRQKVFQDLLLSLFSSLSLSLLVPFPPSILPSLTLHLFCLPPSLFLPSRLPPTPPPPASLSLSLFSITRQLCSLVLHLTTSSPLSNKNYQDDAQAHNTYTQVLAVFTCDKVWFRLPYLIGYSEDIVFWQKLLLTGDEKLENIHQHYRERLSILYNQKYQYMQSLNIMAVWPQSECK